MTATLVVAENAGRALPPPATTMPAVAADNEIIIVKFKNIFVSFVREYAVDTHLLLRCIASTFFFSLGLFTASAYGSQVDSTRPCGKFCHPVRWLRVPAQSIYLRHKHKSIIKERHGCSQCRKLPSFELLTALVTAGKLLPRARSGVPLSFRALHGWQGGQSVCSVMMTPRGGGGCNRVIKKLPFFCCRSVTMFFSNFFGYAPRISFNNCAAIF